MPRGPGERIWTAAAAGMMVWLEARLRLGARAGRVGDVWISHQGWFLKSPASGLKTVLGTRLGTMSRTT